MTKYVFTTDLTITADSEEQARDRLLDLLEELVTKGYFDLQDLVVAVKPEKKKRKKP